MPIFVIAILLLFGCATPAINSGSAAPLDSCGIEDRCSYGGHGGSVVSAAVGVTIAGVVAFALYRRIADG